MPTPWKRLSLLVAASALALSGCSGGGGQAPRELSGETGSEAPSAAERPPPGRPIADCAPTESSGPLSEAFWGMHVVSPIGEDFPDAPITATNLTTSQVYWNQVEVAPGKYDFTRLDAIVTTASERRARPMLVLGLTPSFHAAEPGSPTAATTMPDLAAWRAWVGAVADRYGARLDYQVWPEPNIVSNWGGTPEQMAQLTVAASRVIRDRAPNATVVAPATTLRLPAQRRWMDRFWATTVDGEPVADAVDAVALDPFPLEAGTPEDGLDLLCQARAILAEHDVDVPVWTNEINYGVASGGTAAVAPYSDDRQSAVVARTYVLHAALDVERVYWLGWFSYPSLAVELERDGITTPAGTTFSVVHRWLADRSRPTCWVDDGVHSCRVGGGRDVLRIYWRVRGASSIPAAARAVRLETATGERSPVAPGDPVRVAQSPIAVFSS